MRCRHLLIASKQLSTAIALALSFAGLIDVRDANAQSKPFSKEGAGFLQVQAQRSGTQDKSVVTLDSLPQKKLPTGSFDGWCGLQDRWFMQTDQTIRVVGPGTESFPTFKRYPNLFEFECDNDGNRLTYLDGVYKKVLQVDLVRGETSILAAFEADNDSLGFSVSVSPDKNKIVIGEHLRQATSNKDRSVALINEPDNGLGSIVWKKDSSMFFGASYGSQPNRQILKVFDLKNHLLDSWVLPEDLFLREGVFTEDGRGVLLFMSPEDSDIEGAVFHCTFNNPECATVVAAVEQATFSENGAIATVHGLERRKRTDADGDADILPDKYLVEIRKQITQVVVRQAFTIRQRFYLMAHMNPSGRTLILTWVDDSTEFCRNNSNSYLCDTGAIIDLTGRM